ncbi:hypothetical protein RUM44_007072 [Polyplax serrata]|uniref:Uncharacterized protein n=1 Tax=Polyplax serrata TaxID=468196 RepID=A0ABR1B0F5_POLSC
MDDVGEGEVPVREPVDFSAFSDLSRTVLVSRPCLLGFSVNDRIDFPRTNRCRACEEERKKAERLTRKREREREREGESVTNADDTEPAGVKKSTRTGTCESDSLVIDWRQPRPFSERQGENFKRDRGTEQEHPTTTTAAAATAATTAAAAADNFSRGSLQTSLIKHYAGG